MTDLISRQAAIDAINHICPVDTEYDCTLLDRVDVRYVLSDLPSAEPVKHGKWIDTHEKDEWYCTVYKCSVCGCEILGKGYKFCGGCGARMDKK